MKRTAAASAIHATGRIREIDGGSSRNETESANRMK